MDDAVTVSLKVGAVGTGRQWTQMALGAICKGCPWGECLPLPLLLLFADGYSAFLLSVSKL